ncbi:DUF968 domain-containing protein [Neptunomonas japonica]|uniref:DUF968 domain-containing protein n=1 Tax=Neptunomonas japonica TaxID=417574 RepID=UPI000687C87C|nr:DUF968 domain-containing protein [Neptunomonas japonica]
MAAKQKAFRSPKYLKWVKSLPCCMCFGNADDPHHIKGVGHLSGGSMTAPDNFVMPMCRNCHAEMHRNPELWPDQWEYVARTLAQAISEGVEV